MNPTDTPTPAPTDAPTSTATATPVPWTDYQNAVVNGENEIVWLFVAIAAILLFAVGVMLVKALR